jgi:hypothetical protein
MGAKAECESGLPAGLNGYNQHSKVRVPNLGNISGLGMENYGVLKEMCRLYQTSDKKPAVNDALL